MDCPYKSSMTVGAILSDSPGILFFASYLKSTWFFHLEVFQAI